MMQELFKNSPTISYGKRKNLASGIVEDYLILPDSTKGFTFDEKGAFEKICKSFSWTSTSNPGEILPPCFGFFPFGDGSSILVARFIDDGRDNQGRADLLRVDGLKVPAQLFHELKSDLRLVLDSSIWKNIFAVENSMAESTVISSDDCEKIFELVKKNIKVPLLVGCSKNFKFKPSAGKFNAFDINSKTVEEISVPEVLINPVFPGPHKAPNPRSPVIVKTNLRLLVTLVVVILGLTWYGFVYQNKQIETIRNDASIAQGALNKTIGDKEKVIKDKDDEIKKKEDIIQVKNGTIDGLEKSKTKFPLDEIMKKLDSDPKYENARKILEVYKKNARDSFIERVKIEFINYQDKSVKKWAEELKVPESKVKKIGDKISDL